MHRYILLPVYFLTIVIFTSGCLPVDRAPPYMKEVQQIRGAYIKRMEEQHGLRVFGAGGELMTDVKAIYVYFTAPYNATISEARDLAVAVTEEILADINSNENIRPYLRNYPFTPANVQLGINFAPRDEQDPQSVDGITVRRDRIRYLIIGANNAFECIYQEPYEEALEQVNEYATSAANR